MDRRYVKFFQLFEVEKYFESHEILEEIWIEETQCSTRNHPAIVLLQVAVALLHWKKENIQGAIAVFRSSLNHLEKTQVELEYLGINSKKLKKEIELSIEEIIEKKKYRKIEIPTNN